MFKKEKGQKAADKCSKNQETSMLELWAAVHIVDIYMCIYLYIHTYIIQSSTEDLKIGFAI